MTDSSQYRSPSSKYPKTTKFAKIFNIFGTSKSKSSLENQSDLNERYHYLYNPYYGCSLSSLNQPFSQPVDLEKRLPVNRSNLTITDQRAWNFKCFSLVLVTLLFVVFLLCIAKISLCLFSSPNCGLDSHYLIALLLLSLLIEAFLIYQIMLLLSSFLERFNFNLNNKNSATPKPQHVEFNLQSIALVSNYFQVEKPQLSTQANNTANSTPIPSIQLQLIDEDDDEHSSSSVVKQFHSPVKLKKLSVSSLEVSSEFLRKYSSTEEWLNPPNGLSIYPSSSNESVCTEKSDYYLESPEDPRWRSYTPTPPGSPALSLASSFKLPLSVIQHNNNNNLSVY